MKNGWEIKKLGEVCEVIAGQSPEGRFYNTSGAGLPFYQGKKEFGNKFIGKPTTWTTKTTKEAVSGDILMSVRAPVGPVNFSTQNICIGRGLAAIRAGKLVEKEFLFNFFLKHENTITGNAGAVFDSINKSQIEAIEIPLPPLSEQQRIVSILDKAFAALDKAKANAEQNLKNARELFESCLQEVFENKGEDWEEKRLGEVADHSLGKMLDKLKNRGIPQKYIRNQSVRWFEFDLNELTEMPFLEEERDKYMAIKGDLLVCEGGYPGRAAIWQEDYPIFFQKAIHRIRFKNPVYNKWLLYHLFLSNKTGKLKKYLTGTGIQHLTGQSLDKYLLPIPPENDLNDITSRIESIQIKTQQLESIYRRKIADLEEMRKSVLQKAFSGEL